MSASRSSSSSSIERPSLMRRWMRDANVPVVADVTHALHWLMTTDGLQPLTDGQPLLLFIALLSALVHDVGHDGFNNAFHINSNSDIAVRSCYSSPLERPHRAKEKVLIIFL